MKRRNHKGFSLVEMCIVLAVMSLVAVLSVSLLSMSIHGFTASKQVLDVTMQDTEFATRICTAVRESGTSFTIPEKSFTVDKLTAGWNYLGLMKDVEIPASVSRTGSAIDSADALVYIEYAGDNAPEQVPAGSDVLHTDDGYFIRTVIGHSYTDTYGNEHKYSLVFTPTDPYNHAAQTISYTFSSAIGEDGTTDVAKIETLLEAVNAIQVVYQGSSVNPATAIAFRSDFLPTLSVNSVTSNKIKGTVVMVLDVSSSMNGTRITTLRSTAKSFIEELSKNNELNVLLTVFAGYADKPANFDSRVCKTPLLTLANASTDRDKLMKTVDAITTAQYTNLGDGLRVAYYELKRHPEIADKPIFLLVLTDGEVNASTCVKKSGGNSFWYSTPTYTEKDFYLGDRVYDGKSFEDKYVCNYQSNAALGRKYFQYFGRLINEEFTPKTFLVSMYSGMSDGDKRALEEVFDDTESFDASSLTQFTEVFSQINRNIASAMWAFEGPRL